MKKLSPLVLAAFSVASCAAFAQQTPAPNQAPTIADIARQKRAEKAKKVFTTEDMKPAPAEAPPAEPEGTEATEKKAAAPQSSEAVAAATAKVEDLRYREIVLNKNIARFETSLNTATTEGNESRVKTFTESLDTARASLEATTQQRIAAEKELDDMKAAAAAAAATKKKPASKPSAKPKS